VRLFRNGVALRSLASVSALHTTSMAMGDTWQVFARELRGWGVETCGLFGSLSGIGHTAVALLARRSVRRFGGAMSQPASLRAVRRPDACGGWRG